MEPAPSPDPAGERATIERWSYDAALRAVATNGIGGMSVPILLFLMLERAGAERILAVGHAVMFALATAAMGMAAHRASRAATLADVRRRLPAVYLSLFATGLLTGCAALIPVSPSGADNEVYPFILATIIAVIGVNIAVGYVKTSMFLTIAGPMTLLCMISAVLWAGPVRYVVPVGALIVLVMTAFNARFAGLAFRTSSTLRLRNRELLTELVAKNAELDRRAHADDLTGVPNRAGFRRFLEGRAGTDGALTVLYVDLDGFKEINDSFGHVTGDAVLRETASRLSRSVRQDDFVARLGGDEFVVVAAVEVERARELSEHLARAVKEPMVIGGHRVSVSASIGYAVAQDAAELMGAISTADSAMYRAKRNLSVD